MDESSGCLEGSPFAQEEETSAASESDSRLQRKRPLRKLIITPFFRALSNAQWAVGAGGFGCREGCWEEARVHDRALKIGAS